MDVTTAFNVLGLPITASSDEIAIRYRTLAQECHPDRGGDDDTMRQINEARDVAFASLSQTLIPLSAARTLMSVAVEAVEQRVVARENARALEETIRRRATLTLRELRKLAIAVGAAAAVSLFFTSGIPADELQKLYGVAFGTHLKSVAFVIGTLAAVIAWFVNLRIQTVEWALTDFTRHLSTKAGLIDIWSEVSAPADVPVTRAELRTRAADWAAFSDLHVTNRRWRGVARRMQSEEFAQLLVVKAGENNVLRRQELRGNGELIEKFSLHAARNGAA